MWFIVLKIDERFYKLGGGVCIGRELDSNFLAVVNFGFRLFFCFIIKKDRIFVFLGGLNRFIL